MGRIKKYDSVSDVLVFWISDLCCACSLIFCNQDRDFAKVFLIHYLLIYILNCLEIVFCQSCIQGNIFVFFAIINNVCISGPKMCRETKFASQGPPHSRITSKKLCIGAVYLFPCFSTFRFLEIDSSNKRLHAVLSSFPSSSALCSWSIDRDFDPFSDPLPPDTISCKSCSWLKVLLLY